jgi:hypothetical protein
MTGGTTDMNHSRILKRAWHNVWRFRALWIFGATLALTTTVWSGAFLLDSDGSEESPRFAVTVNRQAGETFMEALERAVNEEIDEVHAAISETDRATDEFFARELNVEVRSDILAVIAVLAGTALAVFTLSRIARYVAESSVIQMVDEYEDTGSRQGFWQGLRSGCSRSAWRLFLIDLVINTPLALVFLLLFALALSPLLLTVEERPGITVFGAVFTAGSLLLVTFLAILVAAVLSILKPVCRRVCVLEGQGALESIGRGAAVVRRHLNDVGLTWLIAVGVHFAWPLLVAPVALGLVGAGILAGGGAALMTIGLASQAFSGAASWIIGAIAGFSLFLLILVAPLVFLGGLREVFLSSVWTLTYRELRPRQRTAPDRLPDLDPSRLEAASLA